MSEWRKSKRINKETKGISEEWQGIRYTDRIPTESHIIYPDRNKIKDFFATSYKFINREKMMIIEYETQVMSHSRNSILVTPREIQR